jgi:hypothetical protein
LGIKRNNAEETGGKRTEKTKTAQQTVAISNKNFWLID